MRIDGGEIERADLRQVQARERRSHALRIQKRVLNRKLHVGGRELRHDRAVNVLDHRVHDRLWMNEDIDAIGRHREQMMRLDHLQAFVHQRCGVYRDLGPHRPIRVLESLFRRGGSNLRDCPATKRAA